MNTEYKAYLLSPAWKAKRKQALDHYGKKCAKCHKTKNLQIHHKTYINIFNEPMEDLMVLCKQHHEEIHGISKVKEILIKKVVKKNRKRSKGNKLMQSHKKFMALHRQQFKNKNKY